MDEAVAMYGPLAVPFDETIALEDQTFVGLHELPDERALYEEYLRGFDDVPTLTDPVALPPPRRQPPDFRFGERKDVRKNAREDAETLRESRLRELEEMYSQYVRPEAASVKGAKSKSKTKTKRNRQKRRKS